MGWENVDDHFMRLQKRRLGQVQGLVFDFNCIMDTPPTDTSKQAMGEI